MRHQGTDRSTWVDAKDKEQESPQINIKQIYLTTGMADGRSNCVVTRLELPVYRALCLPMHSITRKQLVDAYLDCAAKSPNCS